MKERVFKIASLLSLLLCAMTVVMWVRSGSVGEIVVVGVTPQFEVACCSQSGKLGLCVGRIHGLVFNSGVHYARLGRLGATGDWTWILVFGTIDIGAPIDWWGEEHGRFGVECWFITPRYWLLTPLFAILPAISLIQFWRARSRIAEGCCPACGYNLTGNESGVCPECGMIRQ